MGPTSSHPWLTRCLQDAPDDPPWVEVIHNYPSGKIDGDFLCRLLGYPLVNIHIVMEPCTSLMGKSTN